MFLKAPQVRDEFTERVNTSREDSSNNITDTGRPTKNLSAFRCLFVGLF